MLPDAIFGDLAAEGDARLEPLRHLGNRFLGDADRPHTVMDAPRPETPLRDLEAAALAEQHRFLGVDAHILQLDFHMAVRRVVITEDGQVAHDRQSVGEGRGWSVRLDTGGWRYIKK